MARGNISDFAGFIICTQARYQVHVKQAQEDWWPALREAFSECPALMQLAILSTVCGMVSHEFMSLCCSHRFIIHLPRLKYLWAVRFVSSPAPVVFMPDSNLGICHSRQIWRFWLLFHHQWPKRLPKWPNYKMLLTNSTFTSLCSTASFLV